MKFNKESHYLKKEIERMRLKTTTDTASIKAKEQQLLKLLEDHELEK